MIENRGGRFARVLMILVFGFLQVFVMSLAQESSPTGATGSPQVIELGSKKYEFSPKEITVKKGARVQLKLQTEDVAHGLKLSIYPEAAREDGNPGLVFAHPQDNAKVKKGEVRVIEFVATRVGTYDFKCSVQCGFGHGRMVGKLIVQE
jgi:cytochrome c oxidase subunit 2